MSLTRSVPRITYANKRLPSLRTQAETPQLSHDIFATTMPDMSFYFYFTDKETEEPEKINDLPRVTQPLNYKVRALISIL